VAPRRCRTTPLGATNAANGFVALGSNTTRINNTASGASALLNNTTGSNIGIGYQAPINVASINGNNIHIGSLGVISDNSVIRIGAEGTQTSTHIAGVCGASPGGANFLVCADVKGNLGWELLHLLRRVLRSR
jgi:hypothetical protein